MCIRDRIFSPLGFVAFSFLQLEPIRLTIRINIAHMSRVRSTVTGMSFLTEYNEPRDLSLIDTSAVKMEGGLL